MVYARRLIAIAIECLGCTFMWICACVRAGAFECAEVMSPVVYKGLVGGGVVPLVRLKGGMNQRVALPRPRNGGPIATAGGCF